MSTSRCHDHTIITCAGTIPGVLVSFGQSMPICFQVPASGCSLAVFSRPRVSIHRHLNPSRRVSIVIEVWLFPWCPVPGAPMSQCPPVSPLVLAIPYRGVWTFLLSSRQYCHSSNRTSSGLQIGFFETSSFCKAMALKPTVAVPDDHPSRNPKLQSPKEKARIPRLHPEDAPGHRSWQPTGG